LTQLLIAGLFESIKVFERHNNFLVYGEALDGDIRVLEEYTSIHPKMKCADFPLVFTMKSALSYHNDIRDAARPTLPYDKVRYLT